MQPPNFNTNPTNPKPNNQQRQFQYRSGNRTAVDPSVLLRMIDLELAERRLYDFVKYAWPIINPFNPFLDNWHIGCVCEHLEALTRLQIRLLILNLPPRHLKSWLVAVFWPAWVWLRDPSAQWMFVAYNDELSERDSDRCNKLIKSPEFKRDFQVKWDVDPKFDAKDLFKTTLGGSRMCTTPLGKGIGFDADYVVFDDPHNVPRNVHDSRSFKNLAPAIDFYDQVITTRANNPKESRKLICGQRIAPKDIHGTLLERENGASHLCIPLEYESRRCYESLAEAKKAGEKYPVIPTVVQKVKPELRDPRKTDGQLIQPARFDEETLRDWKSNLRDMAAAQLQQRPLISVGAIFKREHYRQYRMGFSKRLGEQAFVLDRPGEKPLIVGMSECRFFQTIDTALTAKSQSSYTAVGTWGITPKGQLLAYHVWRAHITIPYQYPAIEALRKGPVLWSEETGRLIQFGKWRFELLFQAIENKASGPGLIQTAIAKGRPLKVLNPGPDDKVQRASSLATLYYSGSVYHPVVGDWVVAYEEELAAFPTGSDDDQVDVASYAGILLNHDEILRKYLDNQNLAVDPNDYFDASEEDIEDRSFSFKVRGDDVTINFDD